MNSSSTIDNVLPVYGYLKLIIQHQSWLLIQHLKDKDFYINYDSYLDRQDLSLIYI